MPAERYFKNAQTWKQISTNVPPAMYQTLRSRVTKDLTMSHLLRELIAESDLMRAGSLPRPSWSVELSQHLQALRDEVTAGKQMTDDLVPALQKEIADLKSELLCMSQQLAEIKPAQNREQQTIQDPLLSLFDAKQEESAAAVQSTTAKEKAPLWPIFGKLTQMFAARGTA